ncbi:MAG: UDP-N-acetylmuramate dehydrogenase [Ruminococcus sp.]|nr:UDP-N-acetylmuramate dehydrogenase [Ruminococcus sp.]
MKIQDICNLAEQNNCKVMYNKMLKEYTSFKIGGVCPAIIEVNSSDSLSSLVKACVDNGIKYLVIGKGSNMLCDDKGFGGIVFHIGNDFSEIKLHDSGVIEVEAGCSLIKLCKFALDNSLTGLEFAYGIPGTVGGAIYMNAGAYGGEIKDVLQSAEFLDLTGKIGTYSIDEMNLSYRRSIFQSNNYIITKGFFKLEKGIKADIESKMTDLMNRRKNKQPLEYPNAGSTFKRPEGQFAGKLIQDCGLKGYSFGGAMVSEKHSGFVINYDNATCEDVKQVIEHVQKTVVDKTGYFLDCEVKIIPY